MVRGTMGAPTTIALHISAVIVLSPMIDRSPLLLAGNAPGPKRRLTAPCRRPHRPFLTQDVIRVIADDWNENDEGETADEQKLDNHVRTLALLCSRTSFAAVAWAGNCSTVAC